MAISERRMKTAIKKYNNLMYQLALDHNTIGTSLSERTEEWNLRDMVSECQYQLDQYDEYGTGQWEALHVMEDWDGYTKEEIEGSKHLARRYKEDIMTFQSAKKDMKDLRQFINTYKKDISDMECNQGHCSMWD